MKIVTTIAAMFLAGAMLAGCTTGEQRATAGAALGGGIAAVTGGSTGQIIAASVTGAAAGVLLDTLDNGRTCRYRNPNTGNTFIGDCP
ncbi:MULTISPECIES: hypothetical protein [unclassified Roseitalea]|uniref:hypothetical protein n=1 Tax=unclassified Roseitalea TaxID=2639107 RepID=UPI00273E4ADF|nr:MULTISPECIES: hypothetical protein [unclassified Roseitalea]